MNFVGVDGCGGGWIAISIDADGKPRSLARRTIKEIWNDCRPIGLMLVDIPIGLREEGEKERLCDLEARRALGKPRSSSVFRAPCRDAINADTYEEAARINKERTGKGLSKQTWNITSKIRQVDEFLSMNSDVREPLREIHPEVLFWALNNGNPMVHDKGKVEGLEERTRVLNRIFHDASTVIEKARRKQQDFEVKYDDVLDALAAAVTAREFGDNLRTFPAEPEKDSMGLPMEIAYYKLAKI